MCEGVMSAGSTLLNSEESKDKNALSVEFSTVQIIELIYT